MMRSMCFKAYGISIVFWLVVWSGISLFTDNTWLVPAPWQVIDTALQIFSNPQIIIASVQATLTICFSFLLSFVLSIALSYLAYKHEVVKVLFAPIVQCIKVVPIVSVIIILLVLLPVSLLLSVVVLWIVLPILYEAHLHVLNNQSKELREFAQVFSFSSWRYFRFVYVSQFEQAFTPLIKTCLGLSWKAGVTAQVLTLGSQSLGGMLYNAKLMLEVGDIIVISLLIVCLSLVSEKAFQYLFSFACKKLSHPKRCA